ncbi:MAG: hypothetical protein JW822_03330 [Spirochaetales bacterium]|nr:hypothetical protein [Spirochaetales bacterium]
MKIQFLIPKIPLPLRIFIFAALELAGLYYQFYFGMYVFSLDFLLSLLIMVGGVFFVIAKSYQNKPEDLGFEDWQPVSRTEFNRIKENLLATQKMSIPFYFHKATGGTLIVILSIIIFVSIVTDAFTFIRYVIDAGIILSPLLLSGVVKLWTPSTLKMKLPCFDAIIEKVQPSEKKLILTPYLRFDKDKQERKIPEDIRFMIEPRRKPEDFMGVQIQAAINNGPNGAVPYLYAVFLCKGQGDTYAWLKKMDYLSFLHEPGGDKEYGFIVVRQQTDGGGYHTTTSDCIRLYKLIRQILLELLRKPA